MFYFFINGEIAGEQLELGEDWMNSSLFRIGASSLLIDIERQLYHYALGRYATKNKMAMS